MRRRRFVTGLVSAATLHPFAALPQDKTYRLGVLASTRETAPNELFPALADYGYVEGRNLIVEWRYSQGVGERWLPLATELAALKVDAIVVQTTPAALAAKQATKDIPIVIIYAIDPVGARLAESLARPGGNVTGLSLLATEISAKALSLLKEAVPTLKRIGVLWNAANPAFTRVWDTLNVTASALGVTFLSDPVRTPEDFSAAFAAIASQRPDAVFVLLDQLVNQHLPKIGEFLIGERLPSASTYSEFTRYGGLMSYGPSIPALERQAADYVARVFKGESPRTLPFQLPTTYELVINLKTAKTLGLIVPQLLLMQAVEVIE